MRNRLGELVKYVFSGVASLKTNPLDEHVDIYGRRIERGEEFFHPQKFVGIPVFDAKSILRHYPSHLEKLRDAVDIGSHRKTPQGAPLFDALYLDVIYRFIEYIHMIPASEDHHHSFTGGLLTHSLEAALESMRWSKERKCNMTDMVDLNSQIKPVLDYCAWLGGLLHDAGKIMRDISVDAVEIIHPLTKRPIPMANIDPILSWHPQKETLIQWARANNISAYSVTWLRHRIHNRHNIDSNQLMQPLLRNSYAMEYILSSPVKQELYSELVRCLSGYTQQKAHLPDCIRMGDSVSTNRALSIQYDPIRGSRQLSTASKLYKCIHHAQRDWDWNREKSRGWIIGGHAYIRWSSGIDSIVQASSESQYGLPTDTRNILTIMESNGFATLFDPDSPNDRILKFCEGTFDERKLQAIMTGRKSVKWIDLIRMTTPSVVFGENPIPPSMCGMVYLPNADLYFYVQRDGEVQPLARLAEAPLQPEPTATPASTPASTPAVTAPKLPAPQVVAAPSSVPQEKPVKTPKAAKPTVPKKEAQPKTQAELPPSQHLPRAAGRKSSLNEALFGNVIPEATPDNGTLHRSLVEQPALTPPATPTVIAKATTPAPSMSPMLSGLLAANVERHVKGKQILLVCSHAEQCAGVPLKEVLAALKASDEIALNLQTPTILTVFFEHENGRVKCIALNEKISKYILTQGSTSEIREGQSKPSQASESVKDSEQPAATKEAASEIREGQSKPSQPPTSVKDESTNIHEGQSKTPKKPSNKDSATKAKHQPTPKASSVKDADLPRNADTEPSLVETPLIPAALSVGIIEPASEAEIVQMNLIQSTPADSLVRYLAQLEGSPVFGLTSTGDAKLNLNAVPAGKYKPIGKTKIMNYLLNNGAVHQDQCLVLPLPVYAQLTTKDIQ